MKITATYSTAAHALPHTGQYRRFWRWHFFAALLVIPFVLWQGVTGVLYLWHEDIADRLWPELRFVETSGRRVDLDAQAHTARRGGEWPTTIKIAADPNRSTQFVFEDANGLPHPRFVDPYTGALLGEVPANVWLPGLTRKLHGGWPLGKPGSWLLELGACWTIVMIATGLYLWWPRRANGAAGVLYPRLRAGSRVFWRDLHAVVGMWFALIFLAFLFTALPWTDAWGNYVLRPIQSALGQSAPAALGFGHTHARAARGHTGDEHTGDGHAHAGYAVAKHAAHAPAGHAPALQAALDRAYAQGFDGEIEVRIGRGDGPITVTDKAGRAADERVLSLDRSTGRILDEADWDDFPAIAKAVSTGVDLHEGTFFGAANRVFNTLVVIALFWLIVTGAVGWYKRRPGRGLAPPAALSQPWPRWLKTAAAAMCVAMPLFGLSVLSVWAADSAIERLRQGRTGV